MASSSIKAKPVRTDKAFDTIRKESILDLHLGRIEPPDPHNGNGAHPAGQGKRIGPASNAEMLARIASQRKKPVYVKPVARNIASEYQPGPAVGSSPVSPQTVRRKYIRPSLEPISFEELANRVQFNQAVDMLLEQKRIGKPLVDDSRFLQLVKEKTGGKVDADMMSKILTYVGEGVHTIDNGSGRPKIIFEEVRSPRQLVKRLNTVTQGHWKYQTEGETFSGRYPITWRLQNPNLPLRQRLRNWWQSLGKKQS